MWPSVRDRWFSINAQWEGCIVHMYADIRGLITTGVGNLIDPVEYALTLPFQRPDGQLASRAEITFEWNVLKLNRDRLAKEGHLAARKLAHLRLPLVDIEQLVKAKLDQFERQIMSTFHAFVEWPADAQFGLLSMCWAGGAGLFPRAFPSFSKGARELDFATCADECRLDDTHNPGLRPRNVANKAMFMSAAVVIEHGLDPSVLYYPGSPEIRTVLESGAPPALHPAEVLTSPTSTESSTSPLSPSIPLLPHPDVVGEDVERYRKERDT